MRVSRNTIGAYLTGLQTKCGGVSQGSLCSVTLPLPLSCCSSLSLLAHHQGILCLSRLLSLRPQRNFLQQPAKSELAECSAVVPCQCAKCMQQKPAHRARLQTAVRAASVSFAWFQLDSFHTLLSSQTYGRFARCEVSPSRQQTGDEVASLHRDAAKQGGCVTCTWRFFSSSHLSLESVSAVRAQSSLAWLSTRAASISALTA